MGWDDGKRGKLLNWTLKYKSFVKMLASWATLGDDKKLRGRWVNRASLSLVFYEAIAFWWKWCDWWLNAKGLARDVFDKQNVNHKEIDIKSHEIPSQAPFIWGLTWHTGDKHATVLFSNRPNALQSSPALVRTQQLTQHSLGRRCHRSLFAMLFESDLISHARPCPSCE